MQRMGVLNDITDHMMPYDFVLLADAFDLRDAGGWNSLAMPSRYVEATKIANEGVKLGED